MRLNLVPVLLVLSCLPARAQSGPCTEAAIAQGRLAPADDAFSYMPPYGKPVIGRAAAREANQKTFSTRTNITRSWGPDHRIVTISSGEMAYEQGTLHMGYDEGGKRTEFEAVMLTVYRARNGVCQMVALTMQPLEEQPKR